MSILVRFGKHKAILRGASWRCAHTPLEWQLNRFSREWVQRVANPDQLRGDLETAIADEAARQFGGKIGLRVAPTRRASHREYHNLRQLDLFEFRP